MTLAEDLITDLDTFFDTDEFAVEATLAGGTKIKVLLTPAFMETLGVENVDLEIEAKYSDVSALVQNSTMVINGVTYYVMQTPIDDGTGIARLPLMHGETPTEWELTDILLSEDELYYLVTEDSLYYLAQE